ncbi:MAG: helix-turn-helix domain-containing protein [Exiguobacterium sp.]|uniref:helix-turn-helix domain-containing protein n=1 Tax=Exiguobacterium alkaliphilum TaxID=1428684 RepID=UPI0029C4BAA5|nr:helix-turn-helix domain-containing protein [Exiguobacterium sp.]MDX5424360.1 helix-turn-helix domain-containing protein [Exiguobacterium sp.]MDX6771867.1 helix-turn-helix domain-containing protein [Exiguobacterium sp.]
MIGQQIKALRKEKKLTQSQLAEGIITKSMLSMIENGKAEASMRSLREIAKRLDVPVQSLLVDAREADLQKIVEEIESTQGTLQSWKDEDVQQALRPYLEDEMNSVWQGKAYTLFADTMFNNGEQQKLLELYDQAIAVFERFEEKEELIMARISQAFYLLMWNRFDEAIERIDMLELIDLRSMKTKTRVEFSMLMVFRNMLYDDDLPGAIRRLEDTLDYMTRTKIYYRVDDVYRVIAICALYLKDEDLVLSALEKAKQYTAFTGDVSMKIRVAMTEALYAIDYRKTDLLKQQISVMDQLLAGNEEFIAAFEMSKGVYFALTGETEVARKSFLKLLEHHDQWAKHGFVDQAIYFEGLLIGTSHGCGDEWIPLIEREVGLFPEGRFRSHLTSMMKKIKG